MATLQSAPEAFPHATRGNTRSYEAGSPSTGGPEEPEAFVGDPIGQRLRLVRRLGSGGMASVWLAEHLTLGTEVAVKLISREVTRRPGALHRFEREARLCARIKSPHIVQIHDYGHTRFGTPYIAMELCEGETLRARLERCGRMSLGELAHVLVQAASGIEAAHRIGVVHRDIKPENIFLCRSADADLVKVLDFGISFTPECAQVERITASSDVLGTAAYMSPEQLVSPSNVDLRTDLWALGVVAYEALTGEVPFCGGSFAELCVSTLSGEFAPVSRTRDDLPRALDVWFAKALHRDPQQRFASAKEMATALLTFVPELSLSPLDSGHFCALLGDRESQPTSSLLADCSVRACPNSATLHASAPAPKSSAAPEDTTAVRSSEPLVLAQPNDPTALVGARSEPPRTASRFAAWLAAICGALIVSVAGRPPHDARHSSPGRGPSGAEGVIVVEPLDAPAQSVAAASPLASEPAPGEAAGAAAPRMRVVTDSSPAVPALQGHPGRSNCTF